MHYYVEISEPGKVRDEEVGDALRGSRECGSFDEKDEEDYVRECRSEVDDLFTKKPTEKNQRNAVSRATFPVVSGAGKKSSQKRASWVNEHKDKQEISHRDKQNTCKKCITL